VPFTRGEFRVISICCSHSQGCKLESQREQKNVKIYSFEWNPEYMLQRLAHWRMRHTRIATPSCARAIFRLPVFENCVFSCNISSFNVRLLFLGVLRFALGMAGARPLISILRQPSNRITFGFGAKPAYIDIKIRLDLFSQ